MIKVVVTGDVRGDQTVDRRLNQTYCCGSIEFVQRRDNEVTIRLDSTKGAPRGFDANSVPLERFFFVVLQRFLQSNLLVEKQSALSRADTRSSLEP